MQGVIQMRLAREGRLVVKLPNCWLDHGGWELAAETIDRGKAEAKLIELTTR